MQKKTMVCSIFCVIFIVATVMPVFAAPTEDTTRVNSYLAKPDSPPGLTKPPKPDKNAVSVDIRNIASGETLMGTVLVIAEVEGDFETVVLEVNGVSDVMEQVGATNRYQTSWVAGAVGGTVAVGTTNTLGLPVRLTDRAYAARIGWDNALADDAGVLVPAVTTTATTTSGDVRGTYAPSSDPDGSKRLVMGILLPALAAGPNATRVGALGVTQA